jgi:hypothetical protein
LWNVAEKAECHMSGYQVWSNIKLKNIFINNPKNSPGVLMGNSTYPMHGVVFENVVVRRTGTEPFGPTYYCEGIEGLSLGLTNPAPSCFKNLDKKHLRA